MPDASVEEARDLAESMLASDLPRRWAHVCGVAQRAADISREMACDGALLVRAAWLHDVGYSSRVSRSGFHPLDGAAYLRAHGYPERLCALVAYHSAAEIEATFFGCRAELRSFADEQSITRDLLWYCDMTVGPDGSPLSFAERMAEVRSRYAAKDYVTLALDESMAERTAAVARAQQWLATVGAGDQV